VDFQFGGAVYDALIDLYIKLEVNSFLKMLLPLRQARPLPKKSASMQNLFRK
jgi:hypothetical protein